MITKIYCIQNVIYSFCFTKLAWLNLAVLIAVGICHNVYGQTKQIGTKFNERTIISATADVLSVDAMDMDGDGDLDVVTGQGYNVEEDKKTVVWFENDGEQNFTEYVIPTDATFARIVNPVDMDNDGDMDIAASTSNGVVWFENNGSQSFTEHSIFEKQTDSYFYIDTVDMDNDGDWDVISPLSSQSALVWFENDGSQNFTEHSIDASSAYHSIIGDDFDLDGDMDVISVNRSTIAWFENEGNQNFTLKKLPAADFNISSICIVDLDNDIDKDIIAGLGLGSEIGVIWYENIDGQNFSKRILDEYASSYPVTINANDYDGDGDKDIIRSLLSGNNRLNLKDL